MRTLLSWLRAPKAPARRRKSGRFVPGVEALEGRELPAVNINQSMLAFCQSQLGLKVASGECAPLADEAERVSLANFIPANPNNSGDYQWGMLVGSITPGHNSAPCQAGDILQFTNPQISFNGGIFSSPDGHHTAIVAGVDPTTGEPNLVYQQNFNGNRTDQLTSIAINGSTLLAGEVDIYQPVPFSALAGTVEFAAVNNTAAAQNVTLYFNGTNAGNISLTAINTVNSYQMVTASGSGVWSIGLNGTTVNVSQAGGYEVYTAANGQAALRPLTYAPLSGPQVIAAAVDSNAQGVTLTFNEAINASTFTTASVDALTGPAGAITPTGVTPISPTQYDVTFAPQAAAGTYTLTVGPNITDMYGVPMNQNGNAVSGESPGDRYTTTFALPMPQALPVSDSFTDSVAHDFISQSGTWSVSGGRYVATPYGVNQDAVSLVRVSGAWPSALQLNVTMNATAASAPYWSNGFVVFDYQSPTNFKFAGAFVGLQQWVIGHRDANGWEIDAGASDPSITANTDFNLQLMLVNSQATLMVGGASKVVMSYSSAFTGAMGLATENSVTQFGGFTLQQVSGATLPVSTFSNFVPQEGGWSVNGGTYGAVPGVANGGDAVSTLLLSGGVPSALEFSATMSATAASAPYWSNGFIIFDYQSPTNFKFAGALVGLQQWVIGHRDTAGWHNDAAVGDSSIAPSPSGYNLQLWLQGGNADLYVGGAGKVSFNYAIAFTGSVGLGTENSLTQFSGLNVQQPPAATLPIPVGGNFSNFVPQEGKWTASGATYGAAPIPGGGGDAVSTLLVNGALPSSLAMSATMNAAAAAGGLFSNGFLIFDYQSPTSFKFAGSFIGLQKWVIGHRDATGWHIDAALSDVSIAPNTTYSLELLLQGSTASLLVGGVSKVSHTYSSAFTGSLGLGTENSSSTFGSLGVQ